MKQHKNTCFSSCLMFLRNKSRSSCIFLPKLWKISLIQNPSSPGKDNWAETLPPAVGMCESPGSFGGEWSGLELTDTLAEKYFLIRHPLNPEKDFNQKEYTEHYVIVMAAGLSQFHYIKSLILGNKELLLLAKNLKYVFLSATKSHDWLE